MTALFSAKLEYLSLTTDWTTGVRSPAETNDFSSRYMSRPALRPTQPPIQWVPGALSQGWRAAGAWCWQLTPFSAEVNNKYEPNSSTPWHLMAVAGQLYLIQCRGVTTVESVSWLGYNLGDWASVPGEADFSVWHNIQTGCGVTQPPLQCITVFFSGLKLPRREDSQYRC
jgi:hypothetical protein